MASAQLLSKTGALSGSTINRPAPFKAQRAMVNSRQRTVVVKAAQGPNDLAMKTFGAIAAAQLALLPMSGAAMADLLPKTATSQSARDALNAKTSALPSLKKTAENAGDAISGDVDVPAGAKQAANALNDATGGDLAGQAKSTAKKATNKAAGALPDNPARAFANKAKSLGDEAKANVTSNPAKEFANRAKSAARDALPVDGPAVFDYRLLQRDVSQAIQQKASATAKQAGNKVKQAADVPSPADFANKAKQNAKKVTGNNVPSPQGLANKASSEAKKAANKVTGSNPAADFANNAKKNVKKATGQGNPISNPAKEFANQARKLKAKATNTSLNLPVATPLYDYSALQTDVGFFGFGNKAEKVANKAQDKASAVADNVADAVPSNLGSKAESAASKVQDKAGDVGDKVADVADKATGSSFNIFDASSVKDAQKTLKANVEKAAAERNDPAEQVFPVGKPGETQEDNAERIRIQAENGATPAGSAKAPTNLGDQ